MAEKPKPISGEINNERPMLVACDQSTPLVALPAGARNWLAKPTPMIEPTSVWELDDGEAEIPGPEVPDDGGDQQREDHGETRTGADLQDQFYRKQGQDAESHGTRRGENAEEIEETGPDDSEFGRHRARIDDSRHRICRVVEAVDEFKSESNQKRKAEEYPRNSGGGGEITVQRISDIAKSAEKHENEKGYEPLAGAPGFIQRVADPGVAPLSAHIDHFIAPSSKLINC